MKYAKELKVPRDEKVTEITEMVELGKKARVVFHDLANHFTALSLSINHLEENLHRDSERIAEYSKRTEKTRLQIEYVTDLLRAHIKNSSHETFNPTPILHKTIESCIEKTEAHKIKISAEITEHVTLYGSISAFTHIITNLLSNALDSFNLSQHIRKKEIHISLEKNEIATVLSIRDTGCGIKNAHLKKIFNEHFTTKQNGHGIGLSATKEYVEKVFNGTITVQSSSKGTQFTLEFPYARQKTNEYVLPSYRTRSNRALGFK